MASWRSMMKIEGSASGSISQGHGSADLDSDPHQNVMDPQHWKNDSMYINREQWLARFFPTQRTMLQRQKPIRYRIKQSGIVLVSAAVSTEKFQIRIPTFLIIWDATLNELWDYILRSVLSYYIIPLISFRRALALTWIQEQEKSPPTSKVCRQLGTEEKKPSRPHRTSIFWTARRLY